MAAAERDLAAFLATLDVEQPGLRVETTRMAKTHQVPFDPDIQAAITAAADDLGYTHRPLMSGAGHDAQEIAAIAPTAMIFVRGEYDGISHNPREYSTPEACGHGINVLATTMLRLAGRP
jgi:N-carbamoyl-L-amino-acid hydrolase